MANDNKKVSQLPVAGALTGSELIPVVQGATSKQTTAQDIADLASGGGGAVDSVNGQTGVVVLTKSDVGLANVDNTSDANKPVSTATQTALNLKADTSSLASVATSGAYSDLSGTPSLGSASSHPASDFATAAQGALADSALQAASLIETHILHVDKNGNDGTGDGSLAKPYASITAAANAIGPAANSSEFNDATKRYYKILVAPGVYTENPVLPTRPHIHLALENACIVGDVKQQVDQSAMGLGTLQTVKLSLTGSDLRSLSATSNTRLGVDGNVIFESITGGSSLFGILSAINTGISGTITQQKAVGGGIYTLQIFLENTNVGGQIVNTSGSGAITLYAHNADTSSGTALGGVSGAVNLNIIRNVRFTGICTVNSGTLGGRWFNVEFRPLAHNFTGASGTVAADANSYASYFTNVPTKGSETFTLLDEARGVKANNSASNYSAATADVNAHLTGIDTALGLRSRRVSVPATSSSAGSLGDYAADANYLYECIATNTWVRVPVSTW